MKKIFVTYICDGCGEHIAKHSDIHVIKITNNETSEFFDVCPKCVKNVKPQLTGRGAD